VAVQAFPEFAGRVDTNRLRKAARAALAAGGVHERVSVVIAGDDTVRALNAQYRGLDEVTDVLSFSWRHPGLWEGEGPRLTSGSAEVFPAVPARGSKGLGEIVISYPQAERQAAQRGHSTADELALLVVHGVLHLQGHDHMGPQEKGRMRALEAQALTGLGISVTLLPGGVRG
jgi:probable rRNA maturation factor